MMKHIYTKLTFLLLLLLSSTSLFGYSNYYSKVSVSANPTGAGTVYVKAGSTFSGTNTSDTKNEYATSAPTHTYSIKATAVDGYTFSSWSGSGVTIANASAAQTTCTIMASSTNSNSPTLGTATAKFTANDYTITLNNHSATSAGTASISVTFDSDKNLTSAITKPAKTNYVFAGYYTGENGAGVQLIDADGNVKASVSNGQTTYTDANKKWKYAGNLTLHAKWTATYYGRAESYSSPSEGGGTYISCNGNTPSGASSYKASDYSNWEQSGQTSAPTCSAYFAASANDGYEFVGWYTSTNGNGDKKSGNLTYTENFTVTSISSSSRTTIQRYAYFIALQTYYFKAQANKVGEGTVYASFDNSSFTAATATTSERATTLSQTQSTITPTAYFRAVESDANYHFAGWYTDAACTDANRVSTNLEYSVVMSESDKTSEATAPTQTLYAKFVQELTPEIKATYTGNPKPMLVGDKIEGAFTFLNTSAIGSGLTIENSNSNAITYDAVNNKITAVGEGSATLTFKQAKDGYIKAKDFEFKFNVSLVSNTLALNKESDSKFVDEFITDVLKDASINSDAQIQTSSTDATIAYYDVANDKIVIPNSEAKSFTSKTVTIKIWQAATTKFAASGEKTFTLTVNKKEPKFTLSNNTLELDQEATLTFENTNGVNVSFSPEGKVSYDASTGKITAVALGETTMTVAQPEKYNIFPKTSTFTINITKKTPTLKVKMNNVECNSLSVAQGSTVAISFVTDPVAEVVVTPVSGQQYVSYVNGVMTAGVAGQTATYSASIAETATYQAKSINFSLTVTSNSSHLPYTNSNGFTVGSGEGTDWTNKYVQIDFEGIPDKLSFKYAYIFTDVGNLGNPTLNYDNLSSFAKTMLSYSARNWSASRKGSGNTHMLYIEASADGNTWSTIWTDDDATSTAEKSLRQPIQLPQTTRHLRFHHSCNFSNSYTSISVSELKYVNDPTPTSIDFGEAVINSKTKTQTATVNWCNIAPMSVTSSDSRISVTPASFGNFDASGTQTITLSYTPASTDETVNAEITLSNGDNTYDKTIPVTAATVRRPQVITWNTELVATGYAMNVGEQYPDANIPVIATATNNGRITFTTADATKIEVIADTAIRAKAVVNKIKIAAHQAGDDEYQAVHDTVEFTVTNLQKQSITWDQNLRGLLTTSDTVHLNARASSGMKITYTSGNTGVVKITNDSVLEVVGEGKTYITATQNGGKDSNGVEWLSVSQDNYVIVRNPNAQCEEVAVSISEITLNNNNLSQEYTLSGIPEKLTFTAKHGTKQASTWGGTSYSSLIVEEYAVKNDILDWYEVFNDVVGTSFADYTTFKSKEMILDETATKIRVRTLETGTDHTVTKILVTRKMFARADVNSVDAEVEADAIWSKEITISHSNIDVMSIGSKKNLLSFSSETIGAGCGDFGNHSFTATFTPSEKDRHYYDTIVITDGKATNTHTIEIPVHLHSNGLTQIMSDFNAPATALSTDANFTLSAKTTSNLPITFATSDTTKARIVNGNELEFVAGGTITVYAIQAGGTKFDSVALEQTLVISKVTPVIAENERPSADNVRYNGTWANDLLTGGTARTTWHGVADSEVQGRFVWSENVDETITNDPNTYDRSVTFKPTDCGKFNEVTFIMPVNVLKAKSVIAVNDTTLLARFPEQNATLDLSTLVTEQTGEGALTFGFVNSVNTATIAGAAFTATALGDYSIRATIAQTKYYTEEMFDFTVSVIEGIVFDGTNAPIPTADDPVIIRTNMTIENGVEMEAKALTIDEGYTLTIADGGMLTVGNESSLTRTTYGNIIVEAGGKLNLGEGQVQVNDFTLYSNFDNNQQPKSGQVTNQQQITANGKAYFILDLDPSGVASQGWYTFTVPFLVDELHGITRKAADGSWATIVNEKNYAIMAFYENLRTTTKNGWKKYTGILQPGQAYTMTIDSRINTYRFEMLDNGTFATPDEEQTLKASEGATLDRGWNGLGNGTMRYISIEGAPVVQMYIHDGNRYLPADAGNAFAVGAAYFFQTQTNDSLLSLNAVGDPGTILRAPQRESQTENQRFSVELTAAGKICDRMFVTCDDEAEAEYVIGKDVQKMGAITGTKYATMCANAKGTQLCAVNAAYSGNQAIIPLQFFSPADAEYTLSLNNVPAEDVYLTRNGVIVWDLTMSEYTFSLNAGTDSSYALLVNRRVNNTATGVDALDNDAHGTDFVEKIIVNDQLYILRDGIMYDAQGKKVSSK